MRIPHPVPVFQAISSRRGGQLLIAAIVLGLVLHAYGVISLTPEPYPIECEARNVHELTAEERARLCP